MKTWQINPMVVSTLTFFPKKVAEKQNLLADKLFMSAPQSTLHFRKQVLVQE